MILVLSISFVTVLERYQVRQPLHMGLKYRRRGSLRDLSCALCGVEGPCQAGAVVLKLTR